MQLAPTIEWCAGFFEGEGNFGLLARRKSQSVPRLQIAQVDRASLDAFQDTFHLGKVGGPYGPYSGNRQAYYTFYAYGQPAIEIAKMLLPYLYYKGEQVREVLDQYAQ